MTNWIDMSETRGPDRQVNDGELREAVQQPDRPFATAKEIAASVGLSAVRVKQRMRLLAESEDVNEAQVGEGPYIYWLDDFER
jgi:predicted ArsR family transcriptional regulator